MNYNIFLDKKLLFFKVFFKFQTFQKPVELSGSDGSCIGIIIFPDFEFSVFKSLDKQPETIALIVKNLDSVSRPVCKNE
jgi:hypothetical protein